MIKRIALVLAVLLCLSFFCLASDNPFVICERHGIYRDFTKGADQICMECFRENWVAPQPTRSVSYFQNDGYSVNFSAINFEGSTTAGFSSGSNLGMGYSNSDHSYFRTVPDGYYTGKVRSQSDSGLFVTAYFSEALSAPNPTTEYDSYICFRFRARNRAGGWFDHNATAISTNYNENHWFNSLSIRIGQYVYYLFRYGESSANSDYYYGWNPDTGFHTFIIPVTGQRMVTTTGTTSSDGVFLSMTDGYTRQNGQTRDIGKYISPSYVELTNIVFYANYGTTPPAGWISGLGTTGQGEYPSGIEPPINNFDNLGEAVNPEYDPTAITIDADATTISNFEDNLVSSIGTYSDDISAAGVLDLTQMSGVTYVGNFLTTFSQHIPTSLLAMYTFVLFIGLFLIILNRVPIPSVTKLFRGRNNDG